MSRRVAVMMLVGGLATLFAWRVAVDRAEAETEADPAVAGNLQEVIASAASEVLKLVKDQPVAVGQITPTGLPDSNGGPAIGELLKASLEKLRPGSVRRAATFEVKGDFSLAPHNDPAEARLGQKVVRVLFRVIEISTGEENSLRLTRFIRDNTSISRLLGVSGPLPLPTQRIPDQTADRRERNKKIQVLVENPKTFVDPRHPSLVGTTAESPFRVEVVAGPLGDGTKRPTEPRPARIENGLAFVDVKRGEVYELRLYNGSPDEVAARVFIDGLDLFHFSQDRDPRDSSKPRFSYLIVPPAAAAGGIERKPSVGEVPGWHKSVSSGKFVSFLVTAYGEGASSQARVAATGPVGVIQVQLSRSYPRTAGGTRSPSNETGFGPERDVRQQPVEREIEPPIELISVRYTR